METLLDRAHLMRQTFDDEDLAREVLALFAGQCERLLPGLVDPALAPHARADLAHTLKGSALGVGAARVADLAGRIEAALRTPDAATADGLAPALAEAVRETLALI
ncbi:Hpt domain-containing protein [Methylobacterium indicum]|uniref:Histidine kinase n=1 Tax=Methylobacterium indicum TaxID=1775910 RepID=A0ABR5H1P1_9HYPH|nr:Hpt domain-containing protein [Methylobacterium indicum]KMO16919.1 histidine kinase [Methylobacterium indicum]KMO23634.1 histidine kinase [Methylobacterium indicum]